MSCDPVRLLYMHVCCSSIWVYSSSYIYWSKSISWSTQIYSVTALEIGSNDGRGSHNDKASQSPYLWAVVADLEMLWLWRRSGCCAGEWTHCLCSLLNVLASSISSIDCLGMYCRKILDYWREFYYHRDTNCLLDKWVLWITSSLPSIIAWYFSKRILNYVTMKSSYRWAVGADLEM